MDASAQSAISNVLRQAFVEAQVRNPSYSLRAFARRLAISPSALSEIMAGKRRISRKIADRLTEKLCLEPRQRQAILTLFRAGGAAAGDSAAGGIEYELLDADKFAAIADWYHFGILSLMETKDFQSDPQWIAARLNIRLRESVAALERLERLGLIKKTRGKFSLTKGRLTSSDGVRNLSLQRAHAANLALAQTSLAEDPVDSRDFCATTMAIDPEKIPEAKQMIREFSDRLASFLETSGKQTEVYKLCLQLFPLSH